MLHSGEDFDSGRSRGIDVSVCDGTPGVVSFGHVHGEPRVHRVDPVPRRLPRFTALEHDLLGRPLYESGRRQSFRCCVADQGCDGVHRWLKGLCDRFVRQLERVFRDYQATRHVVRNFALEEDPAHPRECDCIPREPTDRVVARRLQQDAVQRNASVRRSKAVHSTET